MSATVLPQPTAGDAHALICQLQYLTLPQTALRCLETISAQDPATAAERLCKVITSDPPLTARLLGVANSAFFALPRPIFEVRSAVMNVLGFDLARNLALSMSMSDCFDVRRCQSFDLQRYWTTALLTAHLAADRAYLPAGYEAPPGGLEICGLLQNLGLLTLVHVAPQPTGVALCRRTEGLSLSSALRMEIGIDHRQALEVIVGRWKLPEVIAEVGGRSSPNSMDGLQLRPIVEQAHERACQWWETARPGIEDAATAVPGTGNATRSPPGTSARTNVEAVPAAVAERIFRLVECCVPMR
ncbi:MAG TPA: hypothetical protein DCY89_01405 [Gammaproteobacteria bacterium]|nr:hypothetical protein [Gammaproteobacteria bacterium]